LFFSALLVLPKVLCRAIYFTLLKKLWKEARQFLFEKKENLKPVLNWPIKD